MKGYRYLSFAKKMGKNWSGKYSQKFFDHDKLSAVAALTTISKRVIQKTADATGDLTGIKINDAAAKSYCNKITKVRKTSPQHTHIYHKKKDNKLLTKN